MPAAFQGHEAELGLFVDYCRATCERLLELLALGLDVSQCKHDIQPRHPASDLNLVSH